jgi:hypothetical protein
VRGAGGGAGQVPAPCTSCCWSNVRAPWHLEQQEQNQHVLYAGSMTPSQAFLGCSNVNAGGGRHAPANDLWWMWTLALRRVSRDVIAWRHALRDTEGPRSFALHVKKREGMWINGGSSPHSSACKVQQP